MFGAIGWCVLLVVGLVWNLFVVLAGDVGCARRAGDSNLGRLEWSVLPPGPKCVWTKRVNGVEATDGPGSVDSLYVGALLVGGVCVLRANRRSLQAGAAGRQGLSTK